MSSLPPSSSASLNGYSYHFNGVAPSESATSVTRSYDGPESLPASAHPANGYTHCPYPSHNEEVIHHLYHSGFQIGNYADTILHVQQTIYRLHAIILSRSPYLAHLMSTSPQGNGQRTVYVNLEKEPEITQEGFAIALGYLYSSVSLNLIQPSNARAVLAAGCFLGGMDDLCRFAYEACRRSISVESIRNWVDFLESVPSTMSDVTEISELPQSPVFGQYAQKLRGDVFHFLVVTLPEVLDIHGPPENTPSGTPSGRDILLQVFSLVPFDLFKAAVESPTFQIGTDQARFKFAKDAIEIRKRAIARGIGAEETVVLAFGGGNSLGGSAVHVTRKMKKRPLWKVNS